MGDVGDVFESISNVATQSFTNFGSSVIGVFSFGLVGGQQGALSSFFPTGSETGGSVRSLGGVNSQEVRQATSQPLPPKRWIYGRATTSGAIFFLEKDPPFIVIGYLVAQGKSDALERIFVQGVEVSIVPRENQPASLPGEVRGIASTPPYARAGNSTSAAVTAFVEGDVDDGNPPLLDVSFRDGRSDQRLDPIIAESFPNVPLNFRQLDITTVVIRAHFGTATSNDDDHRELWGESFDPLLRIRGRQVFDPRDPAQERDDPTTWKWSDNAALNVADFMRADFGGRIPGDLINYVTVGDAADLSDELVETLGEPERRYTVNGVVTAENTPIEILQNILTASRGTVFWSTGTYTITAGGPREPVATITEDALAGSIDYSDAQSSRELVNTVRSEFVAPDRDFQAANGPILVRDDLVELDGGTLETTLRFPFTEGPSRVQRLIKAHLIDTRLGRSLRFEIGLGPLALQLEAGDIVRVEFDSLSFINGIYQIDESRPSDDFSTARLSMTEFSNDIYAFDPAVDEQPFEVTPIDVETS